MNSEAIARNPALFSLVRQQAQNLLDTYALNPRLASVFATQQRWLLAHSAFALYFRADPATCQAGLLSSRLFELVKLHGLGSINTADAFLKEMEKYGFIEPLPDTEGRRARPLQPTPAAHQALNSWMLCHLATLDGLDGGERLATFAEIPDATARMQPLIADALITHPAIRAPAPTFSLFTWLNNGGVIMEWLLLNMDPHAIGTPQIPVGLVPLDDFANWLRLSRTHLARKLREAEALGSLGWQSKRWHSPMWVSAGFLDEYLQAQAVKLAIIEAVCRVALPQRCQPT